MSLKRSVLLLSLFTHALALVDVSKQFLNDGTLVAIGAKANLTHSAPPTSDLNPETPMHDGEYPLTVEGSFALLWITMVACVPLILPLMDKNPITNTHFVLSWLMWAALFGGVYLFTHILKFQSAHFSTIRSITPVECVYLMSQVITTVGYGDITPALPRGQVFVALYVIAAILVIAMLVSNLTSSIIASTQEYEEEIALKAEREAGVASGAKVKDDRNKPPSLQNLFASIAAFATFAGVGIVFFHEYPGEGKTWFQAVYMSIITLSTVGFGAFTPTTEMGKVFGAFWMVFGSAALVGVISAFTEFTALYTEYERAKAARQDRADRRAANKLVTNNRMDEYTFLKLALAHKGVSEKDIDDIDALFEDMGPDALEQSLDISDVEQKFASLPAATLGKAQGEQRRRDLGDVKR